MNFPDKSAIMDQVKTLAEEARQTGPIGDALFKAAKDAAGDQPGVIAPIYMGKEHEIIPERYVIHFALVQCKNCGSATRESEFYALTHLRSRLTGKRVRHLTKCTSAQFNVPVEKILTGCSHIPYCQACSTIDLSHLPPPPVESQLYDLAEPRLKGAKPRPAVEKKEAKPSTKATLDDLA